MRSLAALLVLGLVLGIAASSLAEEPVTILLLPLDAPGAEDPASTGAAAADLLAAALSSSDDVRLVDRDHVDRLLREQALGPGLAPGEAARIGGILGAGVAVTGTVAATEDGWRLLLRAVRVADGVLLGTVDVVEKRAHLTRAATRAAAELRDVFGVAAPAVRGIDEGMALASLHYLRGLGLERAGLYVEAIGELLEARRLAVRFPETELWMGRAYLRSGQPSHAAIALEHFLEAVPDHALSRDAKVLLDAAGRVSRGSPEAEREPTLAEVLLTSEDPGAREAAVTAAIERGEAARHELASAYRLPHESALASRILLAVADLDLDLFVSLVVADPELLRLWPGDVRKRFKAVLTEGVSRKVARGILSADIAERRRVKLFHGYLVTHRIERPIEVFEEVMRSAADHPDEGVSLDALRLAPDTPENLERIGKRLLDPAYSARYRMELLSLGAPFAHRYEDIGDGILALLADDSGHFRLAARLAANFSGRNASGPNDRAMLRTWCDRAARRAGEILLSRRFPKEALEYLDMGPMRARLEDPLAMSREFLASEVPEERHAGLQALRRSRRPEAVEVAWRALDGDDAVMIQIALAALGELGAPEETVARVLAWWREKLKAGRQTARVWRRHLPGSMGSLIQTLARRAFHDRFGWNERPDLRPPPSADPDAYEVWWKGIFGDVPAKDRSDSGVEGE